jgi:hypothetical protein
LCVCRYPHIGGLSANGLHQSPHQPRAGFHGSAFVDAHTRVGCHSNGQRKVA